MTLRKRVMDLEARLDESRERAFVLPFPEEHLTPEALERISRGDIAFPEFDFTGDEEGWLEWAKAVMQRKSLELGTSKQKEGQHVTAQRN